MKLIFATHNQNKFDEVKAVLPSSIELVSLTDIGCYEEIPETSDSLKGNAQIKADFVTNYYNLPCFADDTGLLVDTLNGAPGVYSARYAGEQKNADANIKKLLSKLEGVNSRSARFETVIALNLQKKNIFFTGIVEGDITKTKKGQKGFGYDPVFQPKGYEKTFAELPFKVKNKIGHRGKAIRQLVDYLHEISSK